MSIIEVKRPGRRYGPKPYLARIRETLVGGRKQQSERFESIMKTAKEIAKQDPSALHGLVRLLGRSVQARAMSSWINRHDDFHFTVSSAMFSPDFPITKDNRTLYDVSIESRDPVEVSLDRDIVAPWPWEPKRLADSLCNLKPGGSWGPWRQDLSNHQVEFWLPWRFGWVHGGNHSITAGIVYGEGKLIAGTCLDVSPVYRHVRCDGRAYFRIHDGKVIAPVSDLEIAAIFEIGRMIVKGTKRSDRCINLAKNIK